jgi:hypothetical protein
MLTWLAVLSVIAFTMVLGYLAIGALEDWLVEREIRRLRRKMRDV